MGLVIETETTGPYPRRQRLRLTCDSGDASCVPATFEHMDGFIESFRLAMRSGWKVTLKDSKRVFYCSECSGKQPGIAATNPGA